MRRDRPSWPAAGLIVALLALLAGCGLWGGESEVSQAFDTPAQVLANEAEALYRDGKYDDAAELFQQLKDRYPYSRYALLADLRVGDAYFKAERYEEAVLAYDDFIRLHPKNEAVPYAIYQMGMVYYQQMLTPDRDPTNARKAAEQFQRLIRQYPKSPWAVRARPRLQEALARLAGHDLFVGKFYYRTGHYRAAIYRFKRVLTQYPDLGLYPEALDYIHRCQQELAKLPAKEQRPEAVERHDLERALPFPETTMPDVLEDTAVNPPVGGVGGDEM